MILAAQQQELIIHQTLIKDGGPNLLEEVTLYGVMRPTQVPIVEQEIGGLLKMT